MASKPPTPSAPPAGVPSSGNTKYAVIAILLLLLIGGIVAYKMSQDPPAPPPLPVFDAGPVVTAPNPRDEEVPPPPPVEEDAGAPVKKTGPAVVGSQCDAKRCTGAHSAELEQMLAFRVKQAHRCYDSALTQDPTLRGKMSIAVRIGANGTTCSASVASNEMGSSQVASCVLGYFRGTNFPPPKGGCADVNIPINFVPRQ